MSFLKSYLLAVLILLGYLIYADGSTCVYEACTCRLMIASCRNLSSIPPLVPDFQRFNVTHLIFYPGSITYVGDNSLPPNLTVINFNGNPITNVSRNAFQASSHTLHSLVFRGATFTELPDALLDLQNLTSLAVSDALIKDWNMSVIQHLNKSLTNINVAELTSWPKWIFELTSLESISISDTNISSIPDNAFSNVIDSLSILSLNNDSLHTVPKAIAQLNLTSLSLTGNGLSDATGIPKAEHIDLSNNALSDPDKLVSALKPLGARIEALYLDSNNLTVIPSLDNLDIVRLIMSRNQISDHKQGSLPQSLTILGLSGNRLTMLPTMVANLPNIENLDLSSNVIINISTTMIHPNLQGLYLQSNNISQLLSTDFPVKSSLRYLQASANPIVNIPADAFKNLQSLTELRLDNTKLTGVPLFLTSLVNLESLSMKNVPGLTCACPRDESLVKWFSSDKLKYVSGTCSNGAHIQDFYSEQNTARCGVVPLLSSLRCISFSFLMLLLLYVFRI
ncbi:hypothetical protein BsWGS_06138 [Bradybaena similaris]